MKELRLIRARRKHAELWLRLRQQESTRKHSPVIDFPVEHLARRIQLGSTDLNRRDVYEYRWIVVVNREEIGTVAMFQPDWAMQLAYISYMLLEDYQGKGLGKAAVSCLVDKLFSETPIVRLMAEVAEDNPASWRLLESLGFLREGVMRDHLRIGEKRVTHYLYALLRREWEVARYPSEDRSL